MDLKDLTAKVDSVSTRLAEAGRKAEEVSATAGAIATDIGAQLDAALTAGAIAPLPAPRLGPKAKPGYDPVIDALNRLPRPLLALTTLALFIVAAVNPGWFEARMEALSTIPEPLWWLAGAVITMFFGSREAFYRRTTTKPEAKSEASKA